MGLFCYPNLAPEGCPPDQCPCFNDEKWCPDPWAEPMYNANGTQCPDPFICVPYSEPCPEKPDNATDNNSTWYGQNESQKLKSFPMFFSRTCYDPYYPPEGCNNDQFMCYMGNDSVSQFVMCKSKILTFEINYFVASFEISFIYLVTNF